MIEALIKVSNCVYSFIEIGVGIFFLIYRHSSLQSLSTTFVVVVLSSIRQCLHIKLKLKSLIMAQIERWRQA